MYWQIKSHLFIRSSKHLSKQLLTFLCWILLFSLTSCETKFYLPENPPKLPECPPPECVRLALVLGGGGARGMAHVGVLNEFEKAGIPIDVIIGCSAGSIVGALYADCPNACYIKQLLKPLRAWDILDINIWFGRYGLVRGGSLRRFMKRNLSCRCFEDLQIPLYVVATDVMSGK